MFRSRLWRLAALALVFVCQAAPAAELQAQLETLAKGALPGRFGIAVIDLPSGASWGVGADQPLPMMSDFKAHVAAAVLARIDAKSLSIDDQVTLSRADLVPGSAVPSLGQNFHGAHMTVSVATLLMSAVSQSDNTAVDALIKLLGGPAAVTDYLRAHGISGTTVTVDERGMSRVSSHLNGALAPPAGETAAQQARREQDGFDAFVAAPPNVTTANASALFLRKLWAGQLLSPASSQYLLHLMFSQTVPSRLRGGLPPGVRLADKTGTAVSIGDHTAGYNDMGIMVWPDGHVVIVVGLLSDVSAPQKERDALLATLARTVGAALHPAP